MGSICCKDGDKYDQNEEKDKSSKQPHQPLEQSYKNVEISVKKAEILREKAQAIVLGTDLYLLNQNSFAQTEEERASIVKVLQQYKEMQLSELDQENLQITSQKVVTYGQSLETKISLKQNPHIETIISVSLPLWRGGHKNELQYLKEGIQKALAIGQNYESLAFTDIASGLFGFPKQEVAEVMVDCVKEFLDLQSLNQNNQNQFNLKQIMIVLRDDQTILQFEREIKKMLGLIGKDDQAESWTNSQIRSYQQGLVKPAQNNRQMSQDNIEQEINDQNEVKAQLIEGEV